MNPPRSSLPNHAWLRSYRLALRLYPAAFRQRFGQELEQVFRAQWHEVAARGSRLALVVFALRCATDLLLTALREHAVEALRRRRTRLPTPPLTRLAWSLAAAAVVTAVFLGAALRLAQWLPRQYLSSARVIVLPAADREAGNVQVRQHHLVDPRILESEMALILGHATLQRAAERTSFSERTSPRYVLHGSPALRPPEVVAILKDKVSVHRYRDTAMLEIRVHDHDPQLAADLANAVAAIYMESRRDGEPAITPGLRAVLTDSAEPGVRPIRPNPYLIVFCGGLLGLLLGVVVALIVWFRLRAGGPPPTAPVPAASL